MSSPSSPTRDIGMEAVDGHSDVVNPSDPIEMAVLHNQRQDTARSPESVISATASSPGTHRETHPHRETHNETHRDTPPHRETHNEIHHETHPNRETYNDTHPHCGAHNGTSPETSGTSRWQTTMSVTGDDDVADNILLVTPSKSSDEGSAVNLSTETSDASIICRICHMSYKETGEIMGTTDCECRGGLETVHRSCLIQWVTYKRSNQCELCGVVFPSVSPPHRSNSMERQRRRIEAVYHQYTQLRPMTRKKRAFLGTLSIFLIITTSATGILTISTEREFQRIHLDPWSTAEERMNSNVTFSICLSFLLFCGTVTVGVLLIWLGLEGSYYRRRERFYSFAQRVAHQEGLDGFDNTV